MMDPKTVGAHIRMRKPALTPLELKVLDNIIADENFSDHTSIKEVAKQNDVSQAMIVKLAKKLDFKGYRELRESLALYQKEEVAQLFSEISPDDNMQTLISKVFCNSIQALEETQAILDVKLLERSADLLYKAREILLFGVGGSAVICSDLAHKLLRLGIRSHAISDANLMMMYAVTCSDDSVVLAVSHSGTTADVINALQASKKQGARTIAVTNYANSPIIEFSDIVLTSTSQGSMFLGENAAARIAMLNILDVLFVALATKDLKRSLDSIHKTQAAVQDKRVR